MAGLLGATGPRIPGVERYIGAHDRSSNRYSIARAVCNHG
jgi:hypothetical protein